MEQSTPGESSDFPYRERSLVGQDRNCKCLLCLVDYRCNNEYHSVVSWYYKIIVLHFVTPRKAAFVNTSECGILHLCLLLPENFLKFYKFAYDSAEGFNFIIDRRTKSCTICKGFSNELEAFTRVHKVSDSLSTLFWVVGLFAADGCSSILLVALGFG